MGGQFAEQGFVFQSLISLLGIAACVAAFLAVRILNRIEGDIKGVSGDLQIHIREEGPKLANIADRLSRIEAQNELQARVFKNSLAPKV